LWAPLHVIFGIFEHLPEFHLDGKEAIAIPLEFSPGSVLLVESLCYLFKVLKRLAWKGIELVVGSAFETGWEHTAQERVFMGIDRHLIQVLPEMLDGVCSPRVAFQIRHHELLREAMRGDFVGERRLEGS